MPGDTERQAAESASGSIADGTIVQTWGFGNAPNQKWVFGKAEDKLALKEANYGQIVLTDFNGDKTFLPYVNMKFSITYTNAARNKFVRKIVTSVDTPQVEANIFGNHVSAAHIYNDINDDIDHTKQYRETSGFWDPIVYYLAENTRNQLYGSPLTVDTRWQIGNDAYTKPPMIFSQIFTFSS